MEGVIIQKLKKFLRMVLVPHRNLICQIFLGSLLAGIKSSQISISISNQRGSFHSPLHSIVYFYALFE